MKIDDIENALSIYINHFIDDLISIFNNKQNREFSNNLKYIISFSNLENMPSNDIEEITNVLNSLIKLDSVELNIFSDLIDNKMLERLNKELGTNEKNVNKIVEQVLLFYKARILILMMTKYNKYFAKDKYDIFLSHSSIDTREVLGLKLLLLYGHNKTAYVDWLDDYELDYFRATDKIIKVILDIISEKDASILRALEKSLSKENITKQYTVSEITNIILKALDNSIDFIYLDSKHSRLSKWMPYELGYAKAKLNKKMYRIVVQYKRRRKGSIKYSSFLEELHVIKDIDKEIS